MAHYVVRRAPWRRKKTGRGSYAVIRKPGGKEVQVSVYPNRAAAIRDATRRNRSPVLDATVSGSKKAKRPSKGKGKTST